MASKSPKKPAAKTAKPILASGIRVNCAHKRLADVVSLKLNPANPNTHPDSQVALLAKIIKHTGWRNPIVVSTRSGLVVKGHGRLEAAKLLQVATVPVDDQDYDSEADELADLAADNKLAELSEIDQTAMDNLFKSIPSTSFEFTGFAPVEIESILANPEDDGGLGSDVTDEVPSEKEAFIVPVALTRKEWTAWVKKKAELDCKSCKAAFRKLAGL
jgi:ParB-like chromosome segregation protein Spo0J